MNYNDMTQNSGKTSEFLLPDQFISTSRKGKAWKEKCADYFAEKAFMTTRFCKRKTATEIHRNWRVLYGEVNMNDMRETFDPLGVNRDDDSILPENTVSYNPLIKGFRTLFNEERKRKNDVRAVAINAEVVNQKDMEFKEKLGTFIEGLQEYYEVNEELPDEAVQKGLNELDFYRKHDQQSAHESMANQFLNWFKQTPDKRLAYTSNRGFQDLTVIGEEIYSIRAQGKDPGLYKVNNDKFIVLGLGESDFVEDGWAWIEWDYLPLNKVVEELGGEVTKAEIKEIQRTIETYYGMNATYELIDASISESNLELAHSFKPFEVNENFRYNDSIGSKYVDEEGNVLVVRFQWVSYRKIGYLTGFDDDGDKFRTIVDENYKVREDLGESIEWIWVPELWEGMKIGEEIYKNIKISDAQMRSKANPAKVRPRYVGTVMTYGDGNKATSIMDDLIPWKRDFDLTMNKLRKLWARHMGNIIRISKSMIPDDMPETTWYRWLGTMGILWEDDFNMDPNSGQFAGNMQSRTPVLNLSAAEDINAAVVQLDYIQRQIDNYMSTPPSRTGELSGNEGLGVTQQAIIGATLSTEDLYDTHEKTMLRVFEVLLEYAKYVWDDEEAVQKQYIMDDMSQQVFKFDSKTMLEAEMGIVMTNASDLRDIQRDIELFGQAFAQNGAIDYSDLMALKNTSSVGAAQRRLEAAEEKKRRHDQEAQQREAELQQQLLDKQMEAEERKHQMELEKIRLKGQMDIEKERLRLSFVGESESTDDNGNGVEDIVEIQTETIKSNTAKDIERMRLQQSAQQHKDDVKLKQRELDIKAQEAKIKAKAASRPSN